MFGYNTPNPPTLTEIFDKALEAYRFRWKRRRLLWRAWRRRRELSFVSGAAIPKNGAIAFSTMRNEMLRVEHWLSHYRNLGIRHFLIVDNDSDDGTAEFLSTQSDVSLWTTPHSYKASRFGVDWLTYLQMKYGHRRWCLTVDADEILVFPDWETQGLDALTMYLEKRNAASFAALMLDMYPKGRLSMSKHVKGADPMDTLTHFDAFNYTWEKNDHRGIFSIRGGPRKRTFFADLPENAPHLHKIVLVKWHRSFAYLSSTHDALPRSLNGAFDARKNLATGVLLHSKFLSNIIDKSVEEKNRGEHFTHAEQFDDYYDSVISDPDLWFEESVRYEGAQQLERLGLMTRGDWQPE